MVELKSIEQLLYFMKSHIHLSRYDEKFIDNISALTTVTTNQVILFHRLLYKYNRQFAKHEMFVDKLVDLPWNVKVVESSPQYTDGHVSIVDDVIYFKCPFSRGFIDEFRKIPLNGFVWNKQKRYYEAPYNIYSLKILLTTARKFFSNVRYCEVTNKLLEEVTAYEDISYWQPTLIKRNHILYIAALNSILNDALGDLKLSEDPDILMTLSKHGVVIGPEFYSGDPRLKFICQSITDVEQADLQNMIPWLRDIKCDLVILSGSGSINLAKKKLVGYLQDAGIEYIDTTIVFRQITGYKNPVLIKFKKNYETMYDPVSKLTKVIHVVNSSPIDIK